MIWAATRRLLQAVATLLLATALFFTAMYVLPGDPVRAIFGFRPPPPSVLADLRASYGLDRSYVVQYARYLGRLLHGDLGVSFYGRSVAGLLVPAIPRSLALLGASLLAQGVLVAGAVAAGAGRPGSWPDRLVRWVTLGVLGIPVIVLGYAIQAVVGVRLGWLPRTVGFAGADGLTSWVLPVSTLALWFAAVLAREARDVLDRERNEPHVRYAVARGLRPGRVALLHTLRPAMAPVVHLAGAQVGQMLAALVIVEGIFDVGGVGTVLFTAIQRQDRAVVIGAATAILVVVVAATAIADVVSAGLDPRQRAAV